MAAEPTERFNRRATDANVEGLRVLVGGLENRIVAVEEDQRAARRDLRENTAITTQTKDRVDEMYALLETARGAFRFAGKVGSAGMWVIEQTGKIRAGHFGVAALIVAGFIYFRTGKLPDWFLAFLAKMVM